jgi:hypothetical protein
MYRGNMYKWSHPERALWSHTACTSTLALHGGTLTLRNHCLAFSFFFFQFIICELRIVVTIISGFQED